MDQNEFEIERDDINKAIIHLLINTQSRLMALQEFVLTSHHEKTGEDFDCIAVHIDKTISFHKDVVIKNLFEYFASLKDVLPKNEDTS